MLRGLPASQYHVPSAFESSPAARKTEQNPPLSTNQGARNALLAPYCRFGSVAKEDVHAKQLKGGQMQAIAIERKIASNSGETCIIIIIIIITTIIIILTIMSLDVFRYMTCEQTQTY